jgi:aminoglycoside 6'-N-acetyltransferase I
MSQEIRLIQQKDEQELKNLVKEFKQYESTFEEAFRTSDESVNQLYNSELIGEGNNTYVYEIENNLAGFITFHETSKNDLLITDPIPALYIAGLFVRSEYRKRGIAKGLMEIAENYAKSKNIKFIKLIMFSNNSLARKFYSELGYDDYETTLIKELE